MQRGEVSAVKRHLGDFHRKDGQLNDLYGQDAWHVDSSIVHNIAYWVFPSGSVNAGTVLLDCVCAGEDELGAASPAPLRLSHIMNKKHPTWFRYKRYPHFDWPPSIAKLESFIKRPDAIAGHAFLPFVSFSITEKRYRPEVHKTKPKERQVMYSSHVDSCIYAYYANMLQDRYEKELDMLGISEVPIAYRKLSGKCNIDFAFDVFSHISNHQGAGVAIAADISDFFGSMNHEKLKKQWQRIYGVDRLNADHYAVFKSLTRYAYVDRDAVFDALGVSKTQRRNWLKPFCSIQDFRNKIRTGGLIQKNTEDHGIPQGSPLSALLSNIYMLDFDAEVNRIAKSRGAYYRRYSDDIIVFCQAEDEEFFKNLLHEQMEKHDLTYSEDKEVISRFHISERGCLVADKPLQYLGFVFNGQRILIRDRTVQRQKRKAKQAVISASRAAKKAGAKRIYRRKIYSQHSHLKDLRVKGRSKYGNFYTYIRKCSKQHAMAAPIRQQMKSHWTWLDRLITDFENDL